MNAPLNVIMVEITFGGGNAPISTAPVSATAPSAICRGDRVAVNAKGRSRWWTRRKSWQAERRDARSTSAS